MSGNATSPTSAIEALKRGDIAETLALIEAGADVNERDDIRDSVLLYSGANGIDEVVVAALAHGGDLTITNRYGGIALIPACERGHESTVRILLDAGAEVNHINDLGWTALHEAIVLSDGGAAHQRIIRMLLDAGADVTIPDSEGVLPIDLARGMGHTAIVEILSAR